MNSDFLKECAEQIKDAGYELVNQADAIAGEMHHVHELTIKIVINGRLDEEPTISVTHGLYTQRFIERMSKNDTQRNID